jgi:hypothetical protein
MGGIDDLPDLAWMEEDRRAGLAVEGEPAGNSSEHRTSALRRDNDTHPVAVEVVVVQRANAKRNASAEAHLGALMDVR